MANVSDCRSVSFFFLFVTSPVSVGVDVELKKHVFSNNIKFQKKQRRIVEGDRLI